MLSYDLAFMWTIRIKICKLDNTHVYGVREYPKVSI